MIELRHFNLYAKQVCLLKNIHLRLQKGRPLTIIGESGAGKSTLAKALLGEYAGSVSGEIMVNGRNIIADTAKQRLHYRRHFAALVSQSTAEALNPQLTVMQHLLETWQPDRPKAAAKSLAKEVARQKLQQFQLPQHLWNRRPRGLSGGEIQRVLLALAMVNNPMLLVLDEATSALDKKLREQLQQQILALASERYIVWIRHDLEMAATMGGDVAVLHKGEIIEYGSVKNVFQSPQKVFTRQLLYASTDLPAQPANIRKDEKIQMNVDKIVKSFKQKIVLNQICFTLKRGEIIALFGASGTGKSTLAAILCKLITADSGEIQLAQENLPVARICQHPMRALPPHFSLFNAVAEPLLLQRKDKKIIYGAVLDVLARVKISTEIENLKRRLYQFSGGEAQRIALARALIMRPKIIIADEMTASLDSNTAHEIIKLLIELQQQGLALLFITHNEALGKQIAHRYFWLHEGRLYTKDDFSTDDS